MVYIFCNSQNSDKKGEMFDHRIYVLENLSSNPLEGNWVEKGQLKKIGNHFL